MKLREFLRRPGFDSALLLTWSFDPVFFERVFLRLLHAGGTGRVSVVMDHRRQQELLERLPELVAAQSVSALGTEYCLDGAQSAGHFHPKLWVRSGPNGALVWVGSGNLTAFGWSGQWELGTAWEVGVDQEDDGGWLRPILEDVRALCGRVATHEAIDHILRASWLPEAPGSNAPVLWSGRRTLAQQVLDRWPGQRFERAQMLTGSTDQSASLARWAASSLGVSRFELAVTLGRCDLQAEQVKNPGCDLRLANFSADARPLHAKLLWLSGNDGARALMGSANFSASAWRRPVNDGGNHELVTVYDTPDSDAFEPLLQQCASAMPAAEFLDEQPPSSEGGDESPAPIEGFRVVEATWESIVGELRLRFEPQPPKTATVELVEAEGPMALKPADDAWIARIKRNPGVWCVRVRIVDGDQSAECTAFVDSRRELRQTAGTRRWSAFFDASRDASTNSEQRRMVEDFARLRAALFKPQTDEDRKASGGGSSEHSSRESPGEPLDPALLAGARVVHANTPIVLGASLRGGIGELLRSIFDFEQDDDGDEPGVDEEGELTVRDQVEDKPSPLTDRTVLRIGAEMDTFFTALESGIIAEQGSPEQVQQAFALPIALALLGLDSGWLNESTAGKWVQRGIVAMIGQRILEKATERFESEGQGDVARELIGDGALLAAARVAVAVVPWPSRLARAVALRDIDATEALRTQASLAHLQALLGCVRLTTEHKKARDVAFEDVRSLNDLEMTLRPRWEDLTKRQREARGEWMRQGEVVMLRNTWGEVSGEAAVKPASKVEVNKLGGVRRRVGQVVKIKLNASGPEHLLNLSLLHRRGVPLPPTRGLIDFSASELGTRERSANGMGSWHR